MEISDDGTDLTISSPIQEPIVESHYILSIILIKLTSGLNN